MMDLTDVHGKALLSFLVSTGCRTNETSEVLLSDVDGDVVTIKNEIGKCGDGDKLYQTSEAREYLDLLFKERADYIRIADARVKGLKKIGGTRPKQDNRLFCFSYTSLHRIFSRLSE